jgi:hypothetical protein
MRERKVNATILGRSEPRPMVRMTERTESVGAFPVFDDPVLEKGFFTGPVSAAGGRPLRKGSQTEA